MQEQLKEAAEGLESLQVSNPEEAGMGLVSCEANYGKASAEEHKGGELSMGEKRKSVTFEA